MCRAPAITDIACSACERLSSMPMHIRVSFWYPLSMKMSFWVISFLPRYSNTHQCCLIVTSFAYLDVFRLSEPEEKLTISQCECFRLLSISDAERNQDDCESLPLFAHDNPQWKHPQISASTDVSGSICNVNPDLETSTCLSVKILLQEDGMGSG